MSNMDRYADFIAKQNGSGLFGVKSTADKIDEAKQTETQHIEITSHTGHRKLVPVHPLNARNALKRYRGLTTTKSARIVSKETIEEEGIDLEESKILDAHFEKQTPEVQNRLNTLLRRGHTYPDAVKKAGATPLGEEAEQIDELSRKTVASAGSKALRRALYGDEKHFKYANLASAKLYPDQYMNSPLKAKVVAKEEIDDGLEAELKAQRQTKESLKKAREQRNAFAKEEVEEIDEGIATYDENGKLVGNYKDLETAKKLKPGHHYAPKGTVLAALDRVGKPVWAPTFKEEAEQVDESVAKVTDHLIKRYGDNVRSSHVRSAANDFGVDASKLSKSVRKKLGKTMLDEENHYTVHKTKEGWHVNQHTDNGVWHHSVQTGYHDTKEKAVAWAKKHAGSREHKIEIKEDNKFLAGALKKLEEGRGRPKKAVGKDFTIHPKTKEKLMHNNPEHMKKIELLRKHGVLQKPKTEAGQHIITQLQKAKTSMTGGSIIHFTHGDSKHVSGAHAAKLLDKYAGMKPNEKEDFQKKIGHSHEQLMKHV